MKLHTEYLDLDHQFKLLQEEKFRLERNSKKQEEISETKINDLQEDITRLNNLLKEKHEQLKKTDEELIISKLSNEKYFTEINQLKSELSKYEEKAKKCEAEKKDLKCTIENFEKQSKETKDEIESIMLLNENLAKTINERLNKEEELEHELKSLEEKINSIENDNEKLKLEINDKDKQITILDESKKLIEKEFEVLRSKLKKYETNNISSNETTLKRNEEKCSESIVNNETQKIVSKKELLEAKNKLELNVSNSELGQLNTNPKQFIRRDRQYKRNEELELSKVRTDPTQSQNIEVIYILRIVA